MFPIPLVFIALCLMVTLMDWLVDISWQISGLAEAAVSSPTETLNLLCKGSDNRTVGATNMNETSSRSHAIFTIHIEQTNRTDWWVVLTPLLPSFSLSSPSDYKPRLANGRVTIRELAHTGNGVTDVTTPLPHNLHLQTCINPCMYRS